MTPDSFKKSNKTFMILSAIGILFVVDAHAYSPLAVMGNILPYNSFFMPMFCFISGYFFKSDKLQNLPRYIFHKCKTLMIPFLAWNFIYGVLIQILRQNGIITYGKPLSFHTLFVQPFLDCMMFEINSPAWFVPALFLVIVFYALLRRLCGRIWNEPAVTLLSIGMGTACVWLSKKGYQADPHWLPFLKMGFLLQFYQIGVLFKSHLEPLYHKIPKLFLLLIPIITNTLLAYKVGIVTLNFMDLTSMSGFQTNYNLLPFITSVSGICFWLTLAELLAPAIGNSRLVNYISDHTFTIMMHHIFFFNLYNAVLAVLVKLSVIHLPFDFAAFAATAWYRCTPVITVNIFYVIFGMCGPLLVKYSYDKINGFIKKSLKEKKSAA